MDENKQYCFLNDLDEAASNEEANYSNISQISRTSSIVNSVKILSEDHFIVRLIIYAVFCNPFIKFITSLLKFNENTKNLHYNTENENIENVISSKEKKTINTFLTFFLLISDIIILSMINEFYIKVFLFFINNLYLLYFSYSMFKEEFESTTNNYFINKMESSTWHELINKLNI